MSQSQGNARRPVRGQTLTRRQMLKGVGATIIGGGAAIFAKSLAADSAGDEIAALVWSDPIRNIYLAAKVAARA